MVQDGDVDEFKHAYRRHTLRCLLFGIVCIILAVLLIGLSVYYGGSDIPLDRIFDALRDHVLGVEPETQSARLEDFIIWNKRLPRAVFAIIAGAGLAVSGAIMQSVMMNPLAEPYTTGISSGACFGVAVAMGLGFTVTSSSYDFGIVLNALIFSIVPSIILLLLNQKLGSSPATLILAGVAISYIFNGFTTFVMMTLTDEDVAEIYRWQVGSLSDLDWDDVPLMAVTNIVGAVIAFFISRKLNILALGDNSAKSLGLNPDLLRTTCLLIISFMVATIIAYCGIIGFVGLVSAHIVRMFIGSDNKFVLPAAAGFGGLFLLASDIIARYLSPTDSIPVGVILAFIGSPIFLGLIISKKKTLW